MKKVISITIGGSVFNIEDAAYEVLSTYLNSIELHFKKDEDKDEIIEDIEISISEKLLKKRKKKDMAITEKDIEH